MLFLRLLLALVIGIVIGFFIGLTRRYRIAVSRRNIPQAWVSSPKGGEEGLAQLMEDAAEIQQFGKQETLQKNLDEKRRQVADFEAQGIEVPPRAIANLKALEILVAGGTTEEAIKALPEDMRQEYYEWSDSVNQAAEKIGLDLGVEQERTNRKESR